MIIWGVFVFQLFGELILNLFRCVCKRGVMSVFMWLSMVRMVLTRIWSSRSARWVEEYNRNCWRRFEVVQSPRCCVFDAPPVHSWNRGRCSTSHRLVTTALVDSGWDAEDRKSSRNALLSGYYHNSGVRMQEDWFLRALSLHDQLVALEGWSSQ